VIEIGKIRQKNRGFDFLNKYSCILWSLSFYAADKNHVVSLICLLCIQKEFCNHGKLYITNYSNKLKIFIVLYTLKIAEFTFTCSLFLWDFILNCFDYCTNLLSSVEVLGISTKWSFSLFGNLMLSSYTYTSLALLAKSNFYIPHSGDKWFIYKSVTMIMMMTVFLKDSLSVSLSIPLLVSCMSPE